MNIVKCPTCGRGLWDDPNVKAVLHCGCGQWISGPRDPWGPGNRPAEDDQRFFGTQTEREDAFELEGAEGTDPAEGPTAYDLLMKRREEEMRDAEGS